MVFIKRLVLSSLLVLSYSTNAMAFCRELFFGNEISEISALKCHSIYSDILLDSGTIEDVLFHSSLALSLTMSDGAIVRLCKEDTELKITDTLATYGSNNLIEVSNTLTINGIITMERDSELTFKFDDQAENPLVVLTSLFNVGIPPGGKLTFAGKGKVIFENGYTVTLNSLDISDPAEFSLKNSAVSIVRATNANPTAPGTVKINGRGTFFIDTGAELKSTANKRWIIGGRGASVDTINILVDRGGILRSTGSNGRISIYDMTGTIDLESGGRMSIGNGSYIEVNSSNKIAAGGLISSFKIDTEGYINVSQNGQLILGENDSNTVFNWDSRGGNITGIGTIKLAEQPNFAGQPLGFNKLWENSVIDMEHVVREIVNTAKDLGANGYSTVFTHANGTNKLRVKDSTRLTDLRQTAVIRANVPIVNLRPGDLTDGENNDFVTGFDATGKPFQVNNVGEVSGRGT